MFSPNTNLNDYSSIGVWGTGAYGAMALKGLKDKFSRKPSFFVDFSTSNKGKNFLGIPVIGPEDLINKPKSILYLCALNFDYILDKFSKKFKKHSFADPTHLIKDIDFDNVDNVFTTNRLSTLSAQLTYAIKGYIQNKSIKEKLFINSLDLVLTERCTLKCANCSNLMQYYKSPINSPEDLLIDSLSNILNSIDSLNELRLIGGEPLINKSIYKIIQIADQSNKIENLVVYTNGTILPKRKDLEMISGIKGLVFKISDYGLNLSRQIDSLTKLLNEYNIFTIREPINTWTDSGRIMNLNRSNKELYDVFGQCCVKDCLTLLHGKLFMCPFSANLYNLDNEKYSYVNYINIKEIDLNFLKKEIKNFIYKFKFMKACNNCNGRDHNVEKIPAAEQTRKVLEIPNAIPSFSSN